MEDLQSDPDAREACLLPCCELSRLSPIRRTLILPSRTGDERVWDIITLRSGT